MEQPLDLYYVMQTWPENNPIVCQLDGKAFSSLTQVCKSFRRICNRIPVQYLAIDFSNAAEHGNKNLIDRFIAQPDGWIFEPGMGEEIPWEDSTDGTVKIFRRSFNRGVQSFLGDYSLYCIKRADTIVRCIATWQGDEMYADKPEMIHSICINLDICDDVVNDISKKCCERNSSHFFGKKKGTGRLVISQFYLGNLRSNGDYPFGDPFNGLDLLDSEELFIKKFGMLMMLILAAQKNNVQTVWSILSSFKIPDSLLMQTLMVKRYQPLRMIGLFLDIEHPYGFRCHDKAPDVVKKVMYSLVMQNMQC